MSSERQEYIKQLAIGTKVEHEHKPTYNRIKKYLASKGTMPPLNTYAKWTAMDHLKEFDDYYEELAKMEKKLKKEAQMDLFDRFVERHKYAAEAVKPTKPTPAAKPAQPANKKPASGEGGGAGEPKPGQKIDPVTGKPMFEGVQFNAGLRTEKDETKVMVKTTKPKADLEFKELASTFIKKVNIGGEDNKKK